MGAPTLIKSVQKSFFIARLPALFYRCQTMQMATKQTSEKVLKLSLNSAEQCYVFYGSLNRFLQQTWFPKGFLNMMSDNELKIEQEFSELCF